MRLVAVLLFALLPLLGQVARGMHVLTHLAEEEPGHHAHEAPEHGDEDCRLCLDVPFDSLDLAPPNLLEQVELELALRLPADSPQLQVVRISRARAPPAPTSEPS
jgi:hypothetical protein